MTRDELLTKLAMEIDHNAMERLGNWVAWRDDCFIPALHGGQFTFMRDEYEQRRCELINKPDDADAPEWATHKEQVPSGKWLWMELDGEGVCIKRGIASRGRVPAGHDCRTTLEPVHREHAKPRATFEMETPEEAEAWAAIEANQRMRDAQLIGVISAHSILNAAADHMNDRAATYDKPEGERSMAATVRAFRATTGVELTEEQGWHFMVLLKLVRSQQGGYRADSYEDGVAYVALAGEAAAKERKPCK